MTATEIATFAGGCFWCMESVFEGQKGIEKVISGYMGGQVKNPSYEAVSSGSTGHAEVVQMSFDPQQISYGELLEIFFRQIDPTDKDGSFVDRGSQYRSAIFFHSPEQQARAVAMIEVLNNSKLFDMPVSVEVTQASVFYPAEEYHQAFHRKNPIRYKFYRAGSGRDRFIEKVWTGVDGELITGLKS